MSLLLVKLLLAPSFVVGASLATRRYGVRIGGLLGGLPVVAGPILLAYALAHGYGFAARAAAATLLGLVSLIGFTVVYGQLASRLHWVAAMLCGWLTFIAFTAIFSLLQVASGVCAALALAAVAIGLAALPRPAPGSGLAPSPPSWDLPLRAGCAVTLVLSLTAVSGWLGPHLSGLLAPFPIIATVLATFTHAQRGAEDCVRLLRGMVSGFAAFALFFFILAITLRTLHTAAGFALATGAAVLLQGGLIALTAARPQAGDYGAAVGTWWRTRSRTSA